MFRHYLLVTVLCLTQGGSGAYSVVPSDVRQPSISSSRQSRRAFVAASIGTAYAAFTSAVSPANALEDLSMPSADDDAKAREKAEMEARLNLKAELKAKAAQPKTYSESVQFELEKKKKEKSMSKEERRNALCEELGRGC